MSNGPPVCTSPMLADQPQSEIGVLIPSAQPADVMTSRDFLRSMGFSVM